MITRCKQCGHLPAGPVTRCPICKTAAAPEMSRNSGILSRPEVASAAPELPLLPAEAVSDLDEVSYP